METKRLFRKAMIICLLVLFTCPSIARRYIPEDLEYNFNLVTGTITSTNCFYGEWGFEAHFNRLPFDTLQVGHEYGLLISVDDGNYYEDYGMTFLTDNSIEYEGLRIDFIKEDEYYTYPDGSELENTFLMDHPVLFSYYFWTTPNIHLVFYSSPKVNP